MCLGRRVWGARLRVWGLGRTWGLEFFRRALGAFNFKGLCCKVEGLRLRGFEGFQGFLHARSSRKFEALVRVGAFREQKDTYLGFRDITPPSGGVSNGICTWAHIRGKQE